MRPRTGIATATGAIFLVLILTTTGVIPNPAASAPASTSLPTGLTTHPAAKPVLPSAASPTAPRPASGGVSQWGKLCTGASPFNCPNAPPSQKNGPMVWDAADHYILLFGGQTTSGGGTILNTSYNWHNGAWTKNAQGPTTLTVATNGSMAYDSTDGYVVMFGGWFGIASTYRSYTFKYLSGTWTLLTPGTAPTSRAGATMFDVPSFGGHGGYTILFGGQKGATWLSDTWEFAAGSWTNVTASAGTPPASRAYAAGTYDSTDHYGMLFGGLGGGPTGTTPFNDTWEWNPTTSQWVQLIASGSTAAGSGPIKQFSDNIAYVTAMTEVVQTCGATGTFAAPANQNGGCPTYAWNGGTSKWSNISATVGIGTAGTNNPRAGYGAKVADYSTGSYAMLFGGENTATVTANASYALGNVPTINTAESTGEFLLGGLTKLYANVTGGTTPYTYSWTTLPSGCSSANASVLTCTPNAASAYPAWSVSVTTPDGLTAPSTGLSITVDSQSFVSGTLNASTFAHGVNSSIFWGNKIFQPTSSANATMINYWNQGGLYEIVRSSPQCDASNYTSGLTYTNSGGSVPTNFNYTQMKTFLAQTGAKWMLCVNGQVNNPGVATNEMNYIENTLGMKPYYWSISNEPDNFIHWNEPFGTWRSTDVSAPTALQWALEVQNYTIAMKAFDPSARIIGIQGGKPLNSGEGAWMYNLSKIDGPNLTAVAEHNYPDGLGTGVVPLSLFLGRSNLTTMYTGLLGLQKNISTGCPTCKLPLYLDEFNSYVTGLSPTTWEASYSQNPFNSVGLINLMKAGVAQLVYYDFWDTQNFSLVNSTSSLPRPAYYLFSNVLPHMPIGATYYENVTTSVPMWNAQAIGSCSPMACGTLIVNANTTVTLNVTVPATAFNGGSAPIAYSMSPSNPLSSSVKYLGGAPTHFSIPPQGIILLVSGNAPGVNGTNNGGNKSHLPGLGIGLPGAFSFTFSISLFLLGAVLLVGGIVGVVASRRARGWFVPIVSVLAFVVGLFLLVVFFP